jgi:FecR-like protein
MRVARLLSVLCVSLFVSLPAHAETAGQVLSAIGDVLALRAGRIVRLAPGAPVESGDQIHTGPDSHVEIRFTDWGVVALRPRSDFIVEDYAYEPRGGGKAFFSLIKGGIRSLTGDIGHRDRSKYRLRTPNATIGIRGTHYAVLMCKQDCRNEDGSLGEDGLYGSVYDGRIAVGPYGGRALEREFGAGESFRLADENSIPAPLFSVPAFFPDRLDSQARSGGKSIAVPPLAGIPPGGSAPPGGGGGGDPVSTVTGGLANTLTSTLPAAGSVVRPVVQGVSGATAGVTGALGPVLSGTGAVITPLTQQVLLPAAGLVGSSVNGALGAPVLGSITPLLGTIPNAVPVVTQLPLLNPVLSSLPPVAVPPVTLPPVGLPTLPPVSVPPVGVPPVTLPPVTVPTLPPVTPPTLPPVGVPTLPPVTPPALPPVSVPTPPVPVPTLPPVSVPTPPVPVPTLPPVSVPTPPVPVPTLPPVSVPTPPVPVPTLPPVSMPTPPPLPAPTLPPVTVPAPLPPVSTPSLPGLPLGAIAPLRR